MSTKTTRQQEILDTLRDDGCDWTHVDPRVEDPDSSREICDCDGLTADSCPTGRKAARDMAQVAEYLEAGEFEAARRLEGEWGAAPATDEYTGYRGRHIPR
jgi:hypothetical protein